MIVVKFFDYMSGQLDVEKALNMDVDVDLFRTARISGLALEAADNEVDMDDNRIYYFRAGTRRRTALKSGTCCPRR